MDQPCDEEPEDGVICCSFNDSGVGYLYMCPSICMMAHLVIYDCCIVSFNPRQVYVCFEMMMIR